MYYVGLNNDDDIMITVVQIHELYIVVSNLNINFD